MRYGIAGLLLLVLSSPPRSAIVVDRRNMIYSKFGCKLTPISKSQDASGRISVQVTAEGSPDVLLVHEHIQQRDPTAEQPHRVPR